MEQIHLLTGRNHRKAEAGQRNNGGQEGQNWQKDGNQAPLLEIENLYVGVGKGREIRNVLEGVTLPIAQGEIVGLVGESGCGKSMASLAILGLLPRGARITGGSIRYQGRELHSLPKDEMRKLRGKELSMIFQDPMTSLNPVLTIGEQLVEMITLHLGIKRREALEHAAEMLGKVGLSRDGMLLREYPHQLSGGMRQRVMIAIALSCSPNLLIADEPTTALDVSIQAQILDLMADFNRTDNTSILLVSHDLGVIAERCGKVAVMYAGQIVEMAATDRLFRSPQHPYTRGLIDSIPSPDKKGRPLYSIPGRVPGIAERGAGCHFAGRCPYADERCRLSAPPPVRLDEGHTVRCWAVGAEAEERRELAHA